MRQDFARGVTRRKLSAGAKSMLGGRAPSANEHTRIDTHLGNGQHGVDVVLLGVEARRQLAPLFVVVRVAALLEQSGPPLLQGEVRRRADAVGRGRVTVEPGVALQDVADAPHDAAALPGLRGLLHLQKPVEHLHQRAAAKINTKIHLEGTDF